MDDPGHAKTDFLDTRIGGSAFALLLLVLLLLVYGQTASFEFVAYDTGEIVLHPRVMGRPSLENLWWLLTNRIIHNWTPLAWYSHVLDHQWFGPASGGVEVTLLTVVKLEAPDQSPAPPGPMARTRQKYSTPG